MIESFMLNLLEEDRSINLQTSGLRTKETTQKAQSQTVISILPVKGMQAFCRLNILDNYLSTEISTLSGLIPNTKRVEKK
jgi:hypothetical protein